MVSFDSFPPLRIAALPTKITGQLDVGTLLEACLTGLDSKRSDVDDDLRTCFENHEQHPDGTRHAIQLQTIVQL